MQIQEKKKMLENLPSLGKEFLIAIKGSMGEIPWELQKRGPDNAWQLYTRPLEGNPSSSLIQMKICFKVATDVRSAFAFGRDLDNFDGIILDEANYDPGAETRFLCQFIKIPLPFSDRVLAWENWGKVIDDNLALNV